MADSFRRKLDVKCDGFNVHCENPYTGSKKPKLNRRVRHIEKQELHKVINGFAEI